MKKTSPVRSTVQLSSAVLLLSLVLGGWERFWVPLLLAGILTGPFWGPWYCAWVCPVNTLQALFPEAFRKEPRRRVPVWLRPFWFGALGLLFALCVLFGLRPGLFTGLTLGSLALAFLLPRGLWCRVFCPWRASAAVLNRLTPPGRKNRPACRGCSVCAAPCACLKSP